MDKVDQYALIQLKRTFSSGDPSYKKARMDIECRIFSLL